MEIPDCYAYYAGTTTITSGTPQYGQPTIIYGHKEDFSNKIDVTGLSGISLQDHVSVSASLEFSEAVSTSKAVDIDFKIGLVFSAGGDKGKGKASGGFSHSSKQEDSKPETTSTTHSFTRDVTYTAPLNINFQKGTKYLTQISAQMRPVTRPFTATSTLPLPGGKTFSRELGTWKGSEFMQSKIELVDS